MDSCAPSWFFEHRSAKLHVFSLMSAGTFTECDLDLKRLIGRLRACLKRGSPRYRNAFLDHLLASLHATTVFRTARIWGWYPSSLPRCLCEVMRDFCHVSRCSFGHTTRGPLFIRHSPAIRRHLAGFERINPAGQLATMSLNPAWEGLLAGETVVVFDDYLTYGSSLGVAGALLRAAGAAKMIGVTMGKFSNKALVYHIRVEGWANLFAPLQPEDFSLRGLSPMIGVERPETRLTLKERFRFDNG